MIPAERQSRIINLLTQHGIVTITDLSDMLGVSHMTIRRDIRSLEEQGRAVAVAGGAQLAERLFREPSHVAKTGLFSQQKMAIGMLAARLIKPNTVIYLDAGTTTLEVAHCLGDRDDLTIVTNDFVIADYIAKETQCDLWHTGGFVERENQSCVGNGTATAISQFNFDVAFISTSSFDSRGVSTPTESKVAVKRAIAKSAARRVLVTDSSKYGVVATFCALPLESLTDVVSDSALSDTAREKLKAQGIKLHLSDGKTIHDGDMH